MIEALLILALMFGGGYSTRWLTEDKLEIEIDKSILQSNMEYCKEAKKNECDIVKLPRVIIPENVFLEDDSKMKARKKILMQIINRSE